jgi:hypothetical protein
MSMDRRDAVKLMGLMAAASTFGFPGCTGKEAKQAQEATSGAGHTATTQPGPGYERQFFTDHEYETVTQLADWVIPADERSGSASDAGVPDFMDFIMTDELLHGREERQRAMRGGLAWIDHQCLERFGGAPFVECSEAQQQDLLDRIAYPEEAAPEMQAGVTFFNSFRDLTASGFFSSKMGVEDLEYIGNKNVAEWTGCPPKVKKHVGLPA